MTALLLLLTIIPSALLTFLAIPLIVDAAENNKRLKKIIENRFHSTPIPRLGGVCFLPIMVVVVAIIVLLVIPSITTDGEIFGLTTFWRLCTLVLSLLIVYITGLYEDLYKLSCTIKLIMQIIAALVIAFGLCTTIYSGISWQLFVVVFTIVYITNSINMIDGIDGLAAGVSFICFLILSICHTCLGNIFGATVAASMLGITGMFFYFNVFSWKNKIYMGETGSFTLGVIIAYLTISVGVLEYKISPSGTYYLFVCTAPLLIPQIDLVRVVAQRIFSGKSPFHTDKNHIHHLMMQYGFTRPQTLRYILYSTTLLTIFAWFIVSFVFVMD